MHLPQFLRTCIAFALLSNCGLAIGAGAPLRLDEAVIRALENNPDLAAFAYQLKAQQGRVQQAGARADLEVGLLAENAFGSGRLNSYDAAETTLSLAFLIEHGARQRRQDAAIAGAGVLDAELEIRRIELAAEATRRFITVLEGQQRLEESKRALQLARQTLDAVQLRVRAAKAPEAEQARARAQLAQVKLDAGQAEHELLSSRRALAALWADTEADFGEASGDMTALPPLPAFAVLRSELDKNPDLERFVSEQRLRASELRLAETRRRPPWRVTAGVRRFEEGDDHALMVGLTVPLVSRSAVQGAIGEARANLGQVEAKRAALRVQLDSQLFDVYQDLKHAYEQVSMLREEVLPSMEEAAEESRYAYERGRYGYVELAVAQRELLDMRRALSAAYANVQRYRIEIERLTGVPLATKTSR